MTTAIIADDEDLPRKDLRRMLAELWPELEILAECEHGTEALEAIQQHHPDIAFLDIRMPGMTGLDVANATKGRCHAVFTTAYDNHALEAFSAGAIDYLLKPIANDRLVDAIARLKARLATKAPPSDLSQLMQELDKRLRAPAAEKIRWIGSAPAWATPLRCSLSIKFYFSPQMKNTRG